MDLLRDLDQVAFVRFASVYREFKDVRDFVEELEPILAESSEVGQASWPDVVPATKASSGLIRAAVVAADAARLFISSPHGLDRASPGSIGLHMS